MPRYILQPDMTSASRSIAKIFRTPLRTAQERRVRALEIITEYSNDPVYKEIMHWLKKNDLLEDQAAIQVNAMRLGKEKNKSNSVIGISGLMVLDLMPDIVDEMKIKFKDKLNITEDYPISIDVSALEPASKRNDISKSDCWHLDAIGLGKGGSGSGVTVAVLDTGIHGNHRELNGKILQSYDFYSNKGEAIFLSQFFDTDPRGHGTHAAGLICGENVGVAPKASLLNCIVLNGGRGLMSNLIKTIEWLASEDCPQQPDIVNISAGSTGTIGYDSIMEKFLEALHSINILAVVATGNQGRDRTCSPGNCSTPLSVGSMDRNRKVSTFSSSGTILVREHLYSVPDLIAPGESIFSCSIDDGYQSMSGTSMAAPIVSGIAALLLEQEEFLSVIELKERLLNSCERLDLDGVRQGNGCIRVDRLLISGRG